MSTKITTFDTIEICCPHCEGFNEIDGFEISVTVWNTDVSRHKDECVFIHICQDCDQKFEVVPHMDIHVEPK